MIIMSDPIWFAGRLGEKGRLHVDGLNLQERRYV